MNLFSKIIVFSVLCLLVLLYVLPFYFPTTKLNSSTTYVDIECGRCKYERYIFGLKVVDRIEQTEISNLYVNLMGVLPRPRWKKTGVFSPGHSNSPHPYGKVMSSAQTILKCFKLLHFKKLQKRIIITKFFQLLKNNYNAKAADKYAESIASRVMKLLDNGAKYYSGMPKIK